MKKMKTYLWQITAKTNLHVGNENSTSYGIIDKAVQRDVLTGLPCINSSSLKGAINEFCCSNGMVPGDRLEIFGSDKKGDLTDFRKGKAIFYDAQLLFLPVQDEGNLFTYATSKSNMDYMKSRLELFGIQNINPIQFKGAGGRTYSKTWQRDDFEALCSDENLPIIARNVLDNGQSQNLWYEQVVPAETIFYAVIQEPSDKLKKVIDGAVIQIGANATIGYGYCKFNLIAECDEK